MRNGYEIVLEVRPFVLSRSMTDRPYQPSFVDRLIDWIDRLPGPAPAFYLVGYLIVEVVLHVGLWIDGAFEVGTIDPEWALNGVWVWLSLMWIHYLESVARRSLEGFAPLLKDKPSEYEALRYRMLEMPARPVLWMTLIAATLLGIGVATDPAIVYEGLSHPIAIVLLAPIMIFAYSVSTALVYFTVRLLRSVTYAYSLVDDVNVVHQRPLYAFSNLTMQSGFMWLFVANLTMASILFVEEEAGGLRIVDYSFVAVGVVIAFAAFILPLRGIHRRLGEAKNDLIEENAAAVERTRLKLYAALDREDHPEVESFDRGLSSLFRLKEELHDIQTWPWRPGTLRTFMTAVVLPLLIWVAQQFLTDYF